MLFVDYGVVRFEMALIRSQASKGNGELRKYNLSLEIKAQLLTASSDMVIY
jgi:hypothetical protein